jgi:hypothetical protein
LEGRKIATRSLGSLTLDLIARAGGFEKGMDRAARAAQTRSQRIQRTMRNLQRTVITVFGALAGGAFVRNVIQATIAQEDAYRQLEARVKSTGQVAGFTADELLSLAGDFQRVTTFGDEAIAAMQSVLLTFTQIRGEEFNSATEAILNMSVALNKNLQEAALQVGKALNDPILGVSALREAGIQLTEEQTNLVRSLTEAGEVAEAQRVILSELETQFGGAARAAADTFGGALTQVKNAFGDLLESRGGLDDAKNALQDLADLLQDPQTIQAANDLTSTLISGFTKVTEVVVGLRAAFANASPFPFEQQIQDTLDELEALERRRTGTSFTEGGISAAAYADELERLNEQLADYRERQRAAFGLIPQPDTGGGERAREATGPGIFGRMFDGLQNSLGAITELHAEIDALQQSFDSQVATYQQQIALTGEVTELERIRYAIARGGLAGITAAQAEQLEGLAATIDANRELQAVMDRGREITESVITPAERLRETYAELNDLLAAGAINYEIYLRAVQQAQDGLAEASEQFDTVRDQLIRNTQDIFADTLFSGFDDGIDGMLDSFRDMLLQMAAQAAAARLTEKLFSNIGTGDDAGGFAKFLGGLFGGGRATGGPVDAGRLYRVNENEPEYFVPGTSGAVVPLSDMGPTVVNHFAIQAPQGTVSRQTQLQIAGDVARTLRASRRNQ